MKKVYVAVSGGVDSSVAAALLKKRGFDVTGVFFKPWSPSKDITYCNWQEDRREAMKAATHLGISFKTWDLSKKYGDKVTKYMIKSYKSGITPNPDVMCNKEIKFGEFLKKALKEGADFIATGHYLKAKKTKNGKATNWRIKLYKAKDKNKDQSYFLWTLTQKELAHCLFPVGDYTKPEIRKIAKKLGLANYDKKDSQGVCFVGQLDMKDFLKKYIKPRVGEIKMLETNEVLGKHEGVYYFTIGQRHGLDIKNGHGPYYVVKKNIKRNILYVSKDKKRLLSSKTVNVESLSWVDSTSPRLPLRVGVKIRYRSYSIPAIINKTRDKAVIRIKFLKTAKSVTPGQSAVFYKGQQLLGGGIISLS